ncbi:ThuA domain-containing protein [Pontibacter sp. G13]|uniref:ThuA domain-containing protein n=1 Tax=Pontibacter sp. G13 TaxID=3074898 RepID=UPI00288AFBAF|nr:ThuA domain-containing protein [Pontibacter sp. G13]WNJ21315.1 ThuA domain-containing protein [Pontibacter sp. G13]
MKLLFMLLPFLVLWGCAMQPSQSNKAPHIVFVIGDEEYRSEESMPMLAQIAKRELGAEISLCYSVDSAGFIDPNRLDHIQGLEALETADLMVMFTRFRALPSQELAMITDYVESGRPIMGFRTSTHAFKYKADSAFFHMNDEWPTQVFGQQWISHHGHFDDGAHPLTSVSPLAETKHPILTGVEPFEAYSWLYHVDGGKWKLFGDCKPILTGHSLKSNHEMKGRLDKFPLDNPVAWTKTYTGESGIPAKVFFTTLGHPYDWRIPYMRRLALNGIAWTLDLPISPDFSVEFAAPYEPNNSGFGDRFKPNQRPVQISGLE